MHELHEVDLNLLVVLEALLQTRSVTAAAERLGLTQSGASRALARLRKQFDDPLFVVEHQGLSPTPRCRALSDDVAACLSAARAVVSAPPFDPQSATGTVVLGMPDHLALLLGTSILERLRCAAPNLDLAIASFSRDWEVDLRTGALDLAFGVLSGKEASLRSRKVLDDPWVVLVRKGHPVLARRWNAQTFARGEHALMFVPGSGTSQVDRALADRGLQRRVVFRASSPIVTAMAAATTDLRVTTTRSLAHKLLEFAELEVLRLPVDAKPLQLPLVWHERVQHDARHILIRSVVADSVAQDLPEAL